MPKNILNGHLTWIKCKLQQENLSGKCQTQLTKTFDWFYKSEKSFFLSPIITSPDDVEALISTFKAHKVVGPGSIIPTMIQKHLNGPGSIIPTII